jgi:chemotaxis receptor (MCP) glutamine deamidase CheD
MDLRSPMDLRREEIEVPPDRFEVVADDAVLTAELSSGIAVCLFDAVEEAGALLHLRCIIRSDKPVDVTDTTLATELLLLDRCVQALREAAPGARNLQAKVAAHLPNDAAALAASRSVLALVAHFLEDAGAPARAADVATGRSRRIYFRPGMGQLQIRDAA